MPYSIADPRRGIEELVVRKAEVFREKQGIRLLTGHRVTTIDPAGQTVSGKTPDGKDFKTPYARLLIATGASAVMPDLPGFDLPGVFVLKNLEDGRRIKQFLTANRVRKIVIMGMGYIALEMCECLAVLNIAVDMVKPNPVFLPWLEPSLAQAVKDEIESKGVGIYAGHSVEKIERSDGGLEVVCPDLRLKCDMVLVAIGVTPNSRLAETGEIELGVEQSIAVDRRLRTSVENIYAAGDCADAYHVVTGEKTWIPLALRANRAGWAAADNVCGKDAELEGVAGTTVFRVFDMEVARTGLNAVEAGKSGFEPVETMIQSRSRAHAHPGSTTIGVNMIGDKTSGRLLGAQMVGKEGAAHRINAAAVALHAHMTVEQFSQTDLSYAPPFGPTWDPLLTAANQLLKKL
jgi:NADPH-dependent 2,4-dienoyl-CoA reductase/sulfur reductase-like enzyme